MSDPSNKIIKLVPAVPCEAEASNEAVTTISFPPESHGFHELIKEIMRATPDQVFIQKASIDQAVALAVQLGPETELNADVIKLPVHQQLAALCIIQDAMNDGCSLGDIFNALAEVRFGGVQLLWEACVSEFKAGNAERAFGYFDYAFEDDCFAAIRVGLKLRKQDFGIKTAIGLLSMKSIKPIVTTMPL